MKTTSMDLQMLFDRCGEFQNIIVFGIPGANHQKTMEEIVKRWGSPPLKVQNSCHVRTGDCRNIYLFDKCPDILRGFDNYETIKIVGT